MNKKTLVRNLIISLAFSALLGYAVYLFLQYDQFFSTLVRNIILICIGALFICIWWIFFVDLKAESLGEEMDDDNDDYDDDDDESGYGNPDMIAEMDMYTSFSDEDEDDLSSIVFVPESTPHATTSSFKDSTYEQPTFEETSDKVSLTITEEDFSSVKEEVQPETAPTEESTEEVSTVAVVMPPEELVDDVPEGISDPTEDGMSLSDLDDSMEVSFELDELDSSEEISIELESKKEDAFDLAMSDPDKEPEALTEPVVEVAIDLPQPVVEEAPVEEESEDTSITFELPQQPKKEDVEPAEIAIELPIPETAPTQEEPVETAIDLSLQNEPAAQEASGEIDLEVPSETVQNVPVEAPVEEVVEAPIEETAPAVEEVPVVEVPVAEPEVEAPVEPEVVEEPVYVKPDVNTVNLHELTPEYIALLDSSERKILANRIMREKRRRADMRAQQEAIMRTQELQLYVAQQAARRAQELAAQQTKLREGAVAGDIYDASSDEAVRRRQETVRNHEALIREAAARRAQEEAAQRQAMRAAQQAALLRDAERRASEQAQRQEIDRVLRLERLRQETERSVMMEAERLAQKQYLEAQRPMADDSASAIQQVQQLISSEREQRAAQERLARLTASQRTQEAANLHMLEMERRRQEAEARKLQQQREQLAQLNIPTSVENDEDSDEFGISLGIKEKLD